MQLIKTLHLLPISLEFFKRLNKITRKSLQCPQNQIRQINLIIFIINSIYSGRTINLFTIIQWEFRSPRNSDAKRLISNKRSGIQYMRPKWVTGRTRTSLKNNLHARQDPTRPQLVIALKPFAFLQDVNGPAQLVCDLHFVPIRSC